MKKEWLPAALLTLVCLALVNGVYTGIVWGLAHLTPQEGLAERIKGPNGQLYYANIAQPFTEDRYFWPRPSAVSYHADGSGGSNKGSANPDFLQMVADRVDTFLAHNPAIKRSDIPVEMVTASGSGLDPDLSPAAAYVQVARVAAARGIRESALRGLVARHIKRSATGLAPERVNVLRLNIALDALL